MGHGSHGGGACAYPNNAQEQERPAPTKNAWKKPREKPDEKRAQNARFWPGIPAKNAWKKPREKPDEKRAQNARKKARDAKLPREKHGRLVFVFPRAFPGPIPRRFVVGAGGLMALS